LPSSFRFRCPPCNPGYSRSQERGGSTELFAAVSFGRSRSGAPLTDTFSVPRMRTPLGPSRTSGSFHRTASTSDIFVVTPRHARPTSVPTDALSVTSSHPFGLRMVTMIHLRAEGLRVAVPVRAQTGESPRMSSVVSRACESKPTSRIRATLFVRSASPRTGSPSLGSCSASAGLRASSWLAPCLSKRPCDPPENEMRDTSDRLPPPERFTYARTSCVPGSLRDFALSHFVTWIPTESWAPCG